MYSTETIRAVSLFLLRDRSSLLLHLLGFHFPLECSRSRICTIFAIGRPALVAIMAKRGLQAVWGCLFHRIVLHCHEHSVIPSFLLIAYGLRRAYIQLLLSALQCVLYQKGDKVVKGVEKFFQAIIPILHNLRILYNMAISLQGLLFQNFLYPLYN